jgi:hypothetical protein
MSATTSSIYTAILGVVATNAGASYQELPYVINVEKNDLRRIKNGYGVRYLEANASEGVTRHYTLDQRFEIILTTSNPRKNDDSDLLTATATLYDLIDDIFKDLVATKVGLPSLVLLVYEPSISEPEYLNDNDFIVLRHQVTVKYRSSTT